MMSRTTVRMMRRRSSQSSPGSSQTETGGADSHGHDFGKFVHIISLYLGTFLSQRNRFPSSGKLPFPSSCLKYNEISHLHNDKT